MSEDRSWQLLAACRGMSPDQFFPPEGCRGETVIKLYTEARRICEGCPVQGECLAEALDFEGGEAHRYGFRGGMSPSQRYTLMKRAGKTSRGVRNHGTNGAYVYHKQLGEDPCEPCRLAHVEYQRGYYARKREELVLVEVGA